jgi:hypothetical protein
MQVLHGTENVQSVRPSCRTPVAMGSVKLMPPKLLTDQRRNKPNDAKSDGDDGEVETARRWQLPAASFRAQPCIMLTPGKLVTRSFQSSTNWHSPPALNVMELGFAQTRLHHVCLCEHDATDSRLWHQGPKLQARRGHRHRHQTHACPIACRCTLAVDKNGATG